MKIRVGPFIRNHAVEEYGARGQSRSAGVDPALAWSDRYRTSSLKGDHNPDRPKMLPLPGGAGRGVGICDARTATILLESHRILMRVSVPS